MHNPSHKSSPSAQLYLRDAMGFGAFLLCRILKRYVNQRSKYYVINSFGSSLEDRPRYTSCFLLFPGVEHCRIQWELMQFKASAWISPKAWQCDLILLLHHQCPWKDTERANEALWLNYSWPLWPLKGVCVLCFGKGWVRGCRMRDTEKAVPRGNAPWSL